MDSGTIIKNNDPVITFDQTIWGHSYRATYIATEIERVFGIPAKLQNESNKKLEIYLDNSLLYQELGECNPDKELDDLFSILSQYLKAVKPFVVKDGSPEDNSHEHQQWMRSVCSGE